MHDVQRLPVRRRTGQAANSTQHDTPRVLSLPRSREPIGRFLGAIFEVFDENRRRQTRHWNGRSDMAVSFPSQLASPFLGVFAQAPKSVISELR
jgi:hypothetical protein